MKNCRVFGKIRPKRGTFHSHRPANCSDATEVTQLLRRRGEREEKKARFALLVFILAAFGDSFWTRKKLPETRLFVAGTFSRIPDRYWTKMKQIDWKRPKRSCASPNLPTWPDLANGLAISKRICEKVPNENCRVLSKMRPKRNKINSHGPASRSEATGVTQLMRRKGRREEEGRIEQDLQS